MKLEKSKIYKIDADIILNVGYGEDFLKEFGINKTYLVLINNDINITNEIEFLTKLEFNEDKDISIVRLTVNEVTKEVLLLENLIKLENEFDWKVSNEEEFDSLTKEIEGLNKFLNYIPITKIKII